MNVVSLLVQTLKLFDSLLYTLYVRESIWWCLNRNRDKFAPVKILL